MTAIIEKRRLAAGRNIVSSFDTSTPPIDPSLVRWCVVAPHTSEMCTYLALYLVGRVHVEVQNRFLGGSSTLTVSRSVAGHVLGP